MPALKEFANFITLNMANLAATYAELLEEIGEEYKTISADRRIASARRLLKAVIEAYESEHADSLVRLFDEPQDDAPRRWAIDITPPRPMLEVECLGQTLAPVVTNLEASKFLWQILAETRTVVLQLMEKVPPAPLTPIPPLEGAPEELPALFPAEHLLSQETPLEEQVLLRTLVDNLPDYIYIKDAESRFVMGNLAVARLMGAETPDELVGKTDFDFYEARLAEQYRADEMAVIASGRSLVGREEPVIDPAGNKRWVSTTKVPLRDSQGTITGLIGIGRDITNQKQLAQQIQESLERRTLQVQTITEVAQEIAMASTLDQRFQHVVDLVQEHFGYNYVNLYLLEENELVLWAGAGEAGRRMMADGHTISLSAEQSLIARTARNGEPVLAADVSKEAAWLSHPLLPQTKAELAVPIKMGQTVLGVLNVENNTTGSLDKEDQLLLLGLCGQIAIAIDDWRTETERKRVTEQLQASEDKIRSLLISTDEAVMLLDENGFIDCNEATLRIFGYTSKDQFINTHPSEQSPPQQPDGQDSWTAANERIATAYQKGSHRFEWLHCRADGTLFPAEVLLTALNLDNKPILQAVARDISDYKRAQAALAEEHTLLRSLIDNVPDRIYAKDTQSRFIICNVAAAHRFGKTSLDEIVGKSDFDLVPRELAERFYADEQSVIQTGQPVINREEPLEIGEDGQVTRWNLATKVPLRDNQGNIIGIVGLGREITELKRIEEALAQEQYLLHTLLDNVPDRIYFKDTDSRFLRISRSQAEMFGLSDPEQAVGKTDFDFFSEEHACQAFEDEQRIISTVQPVAGLEEKETWPDGHETWVLTTKMPLLDKEGRIVGTFGISRDITERKLSEQLVAERAAALETVAQVSTVVTSILDTERLLQTVVDLAKDRFDLYHAHIYLLNETGDMLDLAAGAGKVGRQMMAEGWRIPLTQEKSLVVQAARTSQGVMVNRVHEDPSWLPNPLLPDTRSELAVPLIVADQVLGVLDVQSDKVDYFQDEDLHIQTTLAAQVAVAIQNAEQHEKTRNALVGSEILAREQEVLNELGQVLTARLNIDQVVEEAYRQASRLIDTTNFYIGLYDSEKDEIVFVFDVTDSKIDREIQTISASCGISGYMIHHKTSLLFEDNVREGQEALGIEAVGEEALSWLGIPLMFGDQVLGVMAVQSYTTPRLYDGHSRELLIAIGSQVAIAIHNATLFERVAQARREAEERLQETQTLQQLTQALAGALRVEEVIDAFFRSCTQLLGADYAIFSLVDREQQRVKAVSGLNVSQDHIRRANHPLDSDDIMADIVRTGQTEVITGWDPRFDPENFAAEEMADWGLRIFTPITIRGEQAGLVEVGFKEDVDIPGQELRLESLRTLVDQTAISLESAQRYEASQRAARREYTIREITEKMRAATSLEELVKTTAEELGERLAAGHAVVELGVGPQIG
ncbi:MAG: GAF domain-containing protein [Anaerolineae bacterium]|nr:GAF domain-containing protein [Anaerolineae bacterium]